MHPSSRYHIFSARTQNMRCGHAALNRIQNSGEKNTHLTRVIKLFFYFCPPAVANGSLSVQKEVVKVYATSFH